MDDFDKLPIKDLTELPIGILSKFYHFLFFSCYFCIKINTLNDLNLKVILYKKYLILVNCVGISADRVANFQELTPGLPSKILRVNLMSSVRVYKFLKI